MNLGEFLSTIRLYRKTFAATTLAVLALGAAWLVLVPLQYVSTAQLLVSLNGTTTASAYQNDDVVAGRVNSYVALLTSDVVNQRVVDKLGLAMSPEQLAGKVSAVQVPPNTAVIDIAVTDPSAGQARTIADTVASEFVAYTQSLESPTGEDAQKVQTSVVSAASEPRSRLLERIAIGGLIAILAVLAGAVAVWLRAVTDRVVRTPSQARNATGLPVLAVADSGDAGTLDALEPYRRLRAALKASGGPDDGPVVEISPADVDVDATGIAANLGRATVFAGARCVVVDATGGEVSDAQVSDVVAAGAGGAGEPDTLADAAGWESLERLERDYQKIIVATPPVLSDPSASVISEHADAVVLVVRLGQSRRADVRRAAESLTGVGAQVTGVLAVR